jgi:hypothetical protein
MNFILNNQKHFQNTSAIHSVNTRNKNQLHRPIVNLSCFQKSAYYAGIKIFKRYLITHSFRSIDEFLMFTNKS